MASYKQIMISIGGQCRPMICDGPEKKSALVALINYFLIFTEVADEIPAPSIAKEKLKKMLRQLLVLNIESLVRHGSLRTAESKLIKKSFMEVIESLEHESVVIPLLESVSEFKATEISELFNVLGVPLLHGWVANPEDSIYQSVYYYSYEELLKYDDHLKGLVESSQSENDVTEQQRVLIQNLLDAGNRQLTVYGYKSLCDTLKDGAYAVVYLDNRFSVINKKDGNLLLLESDADTLTKHSSITWRVLDEVGRENIFLTDQYIPFSPQPNVAAAKSKISGETVEATGSSSISLSRSQKRRQKRKLASKKAVEKNLGELALEQGDPSKIMPAAPLDAELDYKNHEAESIAEEPQGDDINQTNFEECQSEDSKEVAVDSLDGNKGEDSKAASQAEEAQGEASDDPASEEYQSEASKAATSAEKRRQESQWDGNKGENHHPAMTLQEPMQCSPIMCGTSSHTPAKEIEPKSVGVAFLKFLLEFHDGSSKWKIGSSTDRVPYFEGIVEAMKHTGSTKLYVPYDFIKMYDKSLAMTIQDNYPRISEDLTWSVRQYLAKHGLDISAELHILHLPEPKSVQSFLDFVKNMDFNEEYDIYGDGLEESPSCIPRRMALGYLHFILKKFREGRCFGGKWDESNMVVADGGSNFFIDCVDETFTPSSGYLDLQKFDAVVLERFRTKKGTFPPYFKELRQDFFLIHDCFGKPERWERYLLLLSYPLALKAPLVRSTFICDVYRAADSQRTGKHGYGPLQTRKGISDWRATATQHRIFREMYDYKNFGNGPWTSVYTITKWTVTHWSLLKFCRHFISHILLYNKKIQDLAIVDIILACCLGEFIAELVRFFIFNCDLDGSFSSPWRHFMASDCEDKPQNIVKGTKNAEVAKTEVEFTSSTTAVPYKFVKHETGRACAKVERNVTVGAAHKSVLIGNLSLIDFKDLLVLHGLQVTVQDKEGEHSLHCGSISVRKVCRTIEVGTILVKGVEADPTITVEGPLCDEYTKIFELVSVWLAM